jgi:hypothetical protein
LLLRKGRVDALTDESEVHEATSGEWTAVGRTRRHSVDAHL